MIVCQTAKQRCTYGSHSLQYKNCCVSGYQYVCFTVTEISMGGSNNKLMGTVDKEAFGASKRQGWHESVAMDGTT